MVERIHQKSTERALAIQCDISTPGSAQQIHDATINRFGRIDVLINNAGIIGKTGTVWELPVDEMDRVYRTNLRGVFLFCRQVIPHMLERDYGRIVNIASIAGKEGNPRMVPYSATKAAVIGLTKSLGKELARTGILVNCITPAAVETDLFRQMTEEHVRFMLSKIPMGRFGRIEEVAAMTAWLCSEECSFTTGGVFDLSGGRATY